MSWDNHNSYLYSCSICGGIKISLEASHDVRHILGDRIYLLSGLTRERTESNLPPIEITTSNARALISEAGIPGTIQQKLDKILQYLEKKTPYAGKGIRVSQKSDYPVAYARNKEEFYFFITQLRDMKLIDSYALANEEYFTLTFNGWNRLDEMHRAKPTSRQVFIAMWFSPDLESAYNEGIARAVTECEYTPMRVDRVQHNEKIDDRIIAEIRKSVFLIADFTGHRGGVYFESGFAMGLNLPVIWTCRKSDIEQAHFDTRQYNHIVWETPEDLYRQLKDRIEATINI